MYSKIKQMIKQAVLNLIDDAGPYPRGQANYNGKTTDFLHLSPYGLETSPPPNSWVLLLSMQGQESAKAGISADFINRKKDSSPGEVRLHNTLTGSNILLKANGDIEINNTNGAVNVNSTQVELGTLTTQALVNQLFMTGVYNVHTHQESGGGTTGVPNQTGTAGTHSTTETKAS